VKSSHLSCRPQGSKVPRVSIQKVSLFQSCQLPCAYPFYGTASCSNRTSSPSIILQNTTRVNGYYVAGASPVCQHADEGFSSTYTSVCGRYPTRSSDPSFSNISVMEYHALITVYECWTDEQSNVPIIP